MVVRLLSLAFVLTTFIVITNADYDKVHFIDCGSQGVDVEKRDVTPTPA